MRKRFFTQRVVSEQNSQGSNYSTSLTVFKGTSEWCFKLYDLVLGSWDHWLLWATSNLRDSVIQWILLCPAAHDHIFYPSGFLCTFKTDAWLMYSHLWSFTGHTATPLRATLLLKNDISLFGKAKYSFSFCFLRATEYFESYLSHLSLLALYQSSLLCFELVKNLRLKFISFTSFQET